MSLIKKILEIIKYLWQFYSVVIGDGYKKCSIKLWDRYLRLILLLLFVPCLSIVQGYQGKLLAEGKPITFVGEYAGVSSVNWFSIPNGSVDVRLHFSPEFEGRRWKDISLRGFRSKDIDELSTFDGQCLRIAVVYIPMHGKTISDVFTCDGGFVYQFDRQKFIDKYTVVSSRDFLFFIFCSFVLFFIVGYPLIFLFLGK
ncbi:hypothetical protein SIN8267_01149 [Sinobacterium norvegicum]|uniref:Uncharacterized protein n=1 Tax=Sinobacterium norvegicum TaxID=1641715 RepID=A0ABM9ACX4_9GAMM|nr:hypothetical protein [Sinobacterium norvegicum]CAH0991048.1 hypothetical protein SIN8267_01149 [Sinobacterium norvegicum]